MNNKLVLLIIVVFTAILLGGMWFFFKISLPTSPNPNTNTNTNTSGGQTNTGSNAGGTVPVIVVTPNGTTTEQGIIVAAQGGNSMIVKDFKKDPETKVYTDDTLYYLVESYTSATKKPYNIFYTEADKSFHITLLKQPLKDTRIAAEKDLLLKLGLSEAQACSLVVYVGVPASVSEEYSGMELGLSFCPGAVSL